MKHKWFWSVSVVLLVGIIVLILTNYDSSKSRGAGDALNADGIREDVAAEIARAFPESKKRRASATQLSNAFQAAIAEPGEASVANELYERAESCLMAVEGLAVRAEPTDTSEQIESWVVNSYERSQAYIQYNAALSGRIFGPIDPDILKCEFDVAKLRD